MRRIGSILLPITDGLGFTMLALLVVRMVVGLFSGDVGEPTIAVPAMLVFGWAAAALLARMFRGMETW